MVTLALWYLLIGSLTAKYVLTYSPKTVPWEVIMVCISMWPIVILESLRR